jgi:hypothetical protein
MGDERAGRSKPATTVAAPIARRARRDADGVIWSRDINKIRYMVIAIVWRPP